MRMYKTFSSLDWKILVAICFITFGLIALFLFLSNRPGQPATKPNPTTNDSGWKTEQEDGFQVKHPPGWVVERTPIVGGGELVVVEQSSDETNLLARVEIKFFPGNQNLTAQDLIKPLTGIGYQQQNITFLNKPAILLEKVIPGSTFLADGQPKKDVKKESFIFNGSKGLYQVNYLYYVDNPSVISTLQKIIKSLIIDQ